MSSRRGSREKALQILYRMDITEGGLGKPAGSKDPGVPDTEAAAPEADLGGPERAEGAGGALKEGKDDEYSRVLVRGVLDKIKEIDGRIETYSEHWRLDRIAIVDRNILRIAVYELLYRPDIPYKVIIDEAIEVAKSYGTTESGAFINGVLDHLHKDVLSDNLANAR